MTQEQGHAFEGFNDSSERCSVCGKGRAARVHRRISRRTKVRGYSTEFTPRGQFRKRYLLDDIPSGLWNAVKEKAAREGISIRALILGHLTEWSAK